MNGVETWPIKNKKGLEVTEMRWMCGVMKKDQIWNKYIRGTIKVAEISKKILERLQWYRHVMGNEDYIGGKITTMEVSKDQNKDGWI